MSTARPRCPLPEPLTPDPLDHRVCADALLDTGREKESLRARRTALALERGVRAVLVGLHLGGLAVAWTPRPASPAEWRSFKLAGWRAPRGAVERRFQLCTPWDFPGLPENRPGLVRGFLRHLARRVRLQNP